MNRWGELFDQSSASEGSVWHGNGLGPHVESSVARLLSSRSSAIIVNTFVWILCFPGANDVGKRGYNASQMRAKRFTAQTLLFFPLF